MMHRMPTLNPRITITLTPSVHALLRELSGLTGNSQSALVAELLETAAPVFERVVASLKAAATVHEEAKAQIAAGLDRAQSKLEEQMQLMLTTMDEGTRPLLEEAEKVKRRAGRVASTPRPVTRGVGPGKTLGSGRPDGRLFSDQEAEHLAAVVSGRKPSALTEKLVNGPAVKDPKGGRRGRV